MALTPRLCLGAGALAFGGYVYQLRTTFLELQADAACEQRLPASVPTAQATPVVRLPRLLSDAEIAQVEAAPGARAAGSSAATPTRARPRPRGRGRRRAFESLVPRALHLSSESEKRDGIIPGTCTRAARSRARAAAAREAARRGEVDEEQGWGLAEAGARARRAASVPPRRAARARRSRATTTRARSSRSTSCSPTASRRVRGGAFQRSRPTARCGRARVRARRRARVRPHKPPRRARHARGGARARDGTVGGRGAPARTAATGTGAGRHSARVALAARCRRVDGGELSTPCA